MKKKKVLIDVNSIVPLFVRGYLSGIGRTTLELVNAFSAIKDDLPFEILLYSQNMKGIGGRNLNLSFQNRHLYLPHRENQNKILGRFPVKELLTGYDLLHIPHNFAPVFSPGKTIVTLHDALFMKIQEEKFDHRQMKKVLPPFMRKVKTVITCSENSKRDMIETMDVSPDKIHVIPWGIRNDLFFPSKEEVKTPYFFSVSCNMERKNTPRLIDVYIELAKTNPINDLILVWDAPAEIRQKVLNSGFSHRIHFIEKVSDMKLQKLYAGATATVFPSLYEGFGLPVLESMACGTPVICSDNSSLPEVGGNAVVYINPRDNQSIRDALLSFENNSQDRELLIKKGLEQASHYTWKKCAIETAKIYENSL